MNPTEAKQIERDFYRNPNPTENDVMLFTEALGYLIDTTGDARYMMQLGGYYYEIRQFNLARKYYEMAAELGNTDAYAGLGYIYYYGRTGKPDYQKAFQYYQLAKDAGDIQCAYKLADMYRNGYYVEKDEKKYCEIIEELYPKVKNAAYLGEPLPEVFTRLARIRAQQNRLAEALNLYWQAREFLTQRIHHNPFFGNLTIMKWLIHDLYQLQDFDEDDFSLYDLYALLRKPIKVRFLYQKEIHEVESVSDAEGCAIRFDEGWYRTVDDFFAKANIRGKLLTTIEDKLFQFEVVKE